MRLPRFLSKLIPNYKIIDMKEWINKGVIELYFEKEDPKAQMNCFKCSNKLKNRCATHQMNIKHLPLFNFECRIFFKRDKGYCNNCKKIRSESLDFLAKETPHLTLEYSWWLGRLTEISTVSRVAEVTGNDQNTLWRVDFDRLILMMQNYKIPPVKRISVDEVHARSKKRYSRESRAKQYFTVVSDLETGRVIWVSDNREKEALDAFYNLIGPDRCKDIEVAAMDQFAGYKASTEEYCPQAKVVWDRFHLMRNFENALNDERKEILENKEIRKSMIHLGTRFKYIFLKKAKSRTKVEKKNFDQVIKDNKIFYKLELIKEKFFTFFNQKTADDARDVLIEVKDWIKENGFDHLDHWIENFISGWDIIENYFKFRVTSALSEGQNNVIKALKRRCFGFKNMTYFKLKIMQVCGYLNSRYVSIDEY